MKRQRLRECQELPRVDDQINHRVFTPRFSKAKLMIYTIRI